MPLMQDVRLASWLVCGIYATIPTYWLMIHPFAGQWRGCRCKWGLLVPLWIAMWCVALWISFPWRLSALHRGPEGWAVAPFLGTFSLILYTRATRGLTLSRLIGRHELRRHRHSDTLVTDGVYGIVRHPMYLGHVSTMFTLALGAATAACFGLFAFALLAGAIMIFFEERELHRRFGAAWEAYRAETPALIPRIQP